MVGHHLEPDTIDESGEDTYTVDVDREVFIHPEEVVVDPSTGGPVVVVLPHVECDSEVLGDGYWLDEDAHNAIVDKMCGNK